MSKFFCDERVQVCGFIVAGSAMRAERPGLVEMKPISVTCLFVLGGCKKKTCAGEELSTQGHGVD